MTVRDVAGASRRGLGRICVLAMATLGLFLAPGSSVAHAETVFPFQASFGSPGSGNGQMNAPQGIFVNSGGGVWLSDTGNSRIELFNLGGGYESQFGSFGSSPGALNHPRGLTIDAGGTLWVADTGNSRLEKVLVAQPGPGPRRRWLHVVSKVLT